MSILHQASSQFHALPADLRERGQEQWQQFTEAAAGLNAFLAQASMEVEEKREADHEKALRACRTQLKAIEELDTKILGAESRLREAERESSATRQAFNNAKATPLPRYALKEETAAHTKAVSEAEKTHENAVANVGRVEVSLQALRMRRNDLQQHLALLEGEEFDLRPQEEKKKSESNPNANPYGLGGVVKSLPAF